MLAPMAKTLVVMAAAEAGSVGLWGVAALFPWIPLSLGIVGIWLFVAVWLGCLAWGVWVAPNKLIAVAISPVAAMIVAGAKGFHDASSCAGSGECLRMAELGAWVIGFILVGLSLLAAIASAAISSMIRRTPRATDAIA